MTIQPRPARKADVTELSHALGRAFYDDPVSMWIIPDDESRAARLWKFFAALTRHHHLGGGGVEVAGDGSTIGAAAFWDPPGRWKQSARGQLMMLVSFIFGFGPQLSTGRRLHELLLRTEQEHPEEPHWYLAVIGSDPSVRGKGYGQALMQSRLDRVDAEHAPSYLESSKAENIAYYQRFGFEVVSELVIPNGGPTLWPMWRAPR
ncbi:GNAT family N-acetyltransferase [Mycobacterium sp.]|uniref:GNAT family N-acetyltransferase n=1 Tax=Mycobacterium sp. TaxID=1785 RepID=UPI0031D3646D